MPGLDRHLVEHCLPIKDDFKPYKQPSRRMSKEVETKVKDEIEKLLKAGDLNRATPKDVYVMPITDMLIDSVANNELLSFMDGYSGYNQIKIDEKDTSKTAFRCPGAIVYIDDIVVKSRKSEDHVEHLRKSFERMRKHNLKLNPIKCSIGVKAGNFLGFLVHQRGVEVDQNKSNAILEAKLPKSKKELQRFLGQSLHYCPQKSIKGQDIADFLAHHPGSDESIPEEVEIPVYEIEEPPWILKFDGSSTEGTAGAGIVIISPTGIKTALSFNLDPCTNNQAEYEALVIGLEVLKDLREKNVQVIGDSQLILRQVAGEYKCMSLSLTPYFAAASQLADDFEEIKFQYVPRQQNWEANELAQIASGLRLSEELTHRLVLIQKRNHPSIMQRGLQIETFDVDVNLAGDWREELKEAL
ncbi:uncharacterized protein [Henckelia pumila]|uniref:uncharacterized protein n=1 Tax=Henckelia pumila TaxID=405737 RepID=UPI003C6E5153